MAMHFEAAGDWRRAVDALCEAARHAQQRHAEAEAAESLEHAMRIAAHLHESELGSAMLEIQSELVMASVAKNHASGRGQKTPQKLDVFWTGT
jgi:hypothetical protein